VLELFSLIVELLGDLLFQLLGEAILDLALRALGRFFRSPEFDPVAVIGIYFVLGTFSGGISLLIVPHPFVRPSRLYGIGLIVSPIVTGLVMSLVGSLLRQKGKKAIQIETFWCGFAFAFGMALTRLIFVR
jgi:hypothetical protein